MMKRGREGEKRGKERWASKTARELEDRVQENKCKIGIIKNKERVEGDLKTSMKRGRDGRREGAKRVGDEMKVKVLDN